MSFDGLIREEIVRPPGRRGTWDPYDPWAENEPIYPPQRLVASVQARPEMSETGIQVGSPRVPASVKPSPIKAPAAAAAAADFEVYGWDA